LGKKAKKGVFITTSIFSVSAIDYARNVENKIILIDGVYNRDSYFHEVKIIRRAVSFGEHGF